uniref:Fucose isomerase n=1 Tax=Ignisphaera aggregans TaxID=334771 RepID=A0A7C2Z195_9CREN
MQPVVAVPFASKVHGEEYYLSIFDVLKRYFMKYGIEVHSSVITDDSEANNIGKRYSEFLPIAIVLTGGTSRLIDDFIDSAGFERLILFSHAEHNSLASAISARNKAERKGVLNLAYHCSDINSPLCITTIDRMSRVARAVASVIKLRVGVVVERDTKGEVEETLESRFRAEIILKSFDELLEKVEKSNVKDVKEYIAGLLNIDSSTKYLEPIATLYLALKKFVQEERLDAITIDCFPFILKHGITPCIPLAILNSEGIVAGCEADLPSMLGLFLAKSISGKSGWIANIVDVSANRCALAHCTIALDITKNVHVVSHFETGKPLSLVGELAGSTVTLLSIDRDFTLAAIALGKVLSSGGLGLNACRTQAILEFDYPIETIVDMAPNNHHVIILGDLRRELSETLYLLGMDVVDYKELTV